MSAPPVRSVPTGTGTVSGTESGGVTSFLGIPYGAAPVGSRRFALPQPPARWGGRRACHSPGLGSPQLVSTATAFDRTARVGPQSEDCLWLNVWTPSPGPLDELPVLVWIHGGAFVHGSAADPVYDGARLANGGLVVVTVNTRLGALGMLDLRELIPRGQCNLTLHDQALALAWVRENIGSFGGDPGRITIAGESVGGTSALAHLGSALEARPTRAIAQSSSVEQYMSVDASEAVARSVLAHAGVRPGDLAALVALPVDRLLAAQGQVLGQVWTDAPGAVDTFGEHTVAQLTPYLPTDDGVFVSGNLGEGLRCRAGTADLLIGTTRDEGALYSLTSDAIGEGWVLANAARAAAAGLVRGGLLDLIDAYEDQGILDLEALETDRYFRCPTVRAADVVGGLPGSRVTTYRMDLSGGPAAHMIDVPLTFGTLDSPLGMWFAGTTKDPKELAELSSVVRAAWTAFCADGSVPGAEQHESGSVWSHIMSREGVGRAPCDRRVRAAWETSVR